MLTPRRSYCHYVSQAQASQRAQTPWLQMEVTGAVAIESRVPKDEIQGVSHEDPLFHIVLGSIKLMVVSLVELRVAAAYSKWKVNVYCLLVWSLSLSSPFDSSVLLYLSYFREKED